LVAPLVVDNSLFTVRVVSGNNMNMSSPHGSPRLGNDAADFAPASPSKIRPAFRKEGRVATPDLECASSVKTMTNKPHDHSTNGNGSAESPRIRKARNFIREHADEELSLTQVARAAHTSANYFSEKFKEATGVNFVKYVAQARYEKAVTLLREVDLRVSEIAFATGFQSLSQFNRVFKKLAGKSPTEFRAQSRAEKGKRG
jgi:AraC-like DNA-binding protein